MLGFVRDRVKRLIVTEILRMAKNSKIQVVNADNTVSTIDLVELAAIDAIAAADLAKIDGITNGAAAAGKALVLGATSNIDTFRMTGKLYTPQAAPETATDTASLTDAQMLSGILVGTPAAAAAYTVRTGTQLSAAIVSHSSKT